MRRVDVSPQCLAVCGVSVCSWRDCPAACLGSPIECPVAGALKLKYGWAVVIPWVAMVDGEPLNLPDDMTAFVLAFDAGAFLDLAEPCEEILVPQLPRHQQIKGLEDALRLPDLKVSWGVEKCASPWWRH